MIKNKRDVVIYHDYLNLSKSKLRTLDNPIHICVGAGNVEADYNLILDSKTAEQVYGNRNNIKHQIIMFPDTLKKTLLAERKSMLMLNRLAAMGKTTQLRQTTTDVLTAVVNAIPDTGDVYIINDYINPDIVQEPFKYVDKEFNEANLHLRDRTNFD